MVWYRCSKVICKHIDSGVRCNAINCSASAVDRCIGEVALRLPSEAQTPQLEHIGSIFKFHCCCSRLVICNVHSILERSTIPPAGWTVNAKIQYACQSTLGSGSSELWFILQNKVEKELSPPPNPIPLEDLQKSFFLVWNRI